MTISNALILNTNDIALECAKNAALSFSKRNPVDFGSCGGAVVVINFGRKTKLKKQFIECGLIRESSTYDRYGKKGFSVAIPNWQVPNYNQQNASYKESAFYAYKNRMEELLNEVGVEIYVDTWCD